MYHISNFQSICNISTFYGIIIKSTIWPRDPILGACSRELWLLSAVQSLDILVSHAPGESLSLADALSRAHSEPSMKSLAGSLVNKLGLSHVTPVPVHNVLTLSV